MWPCEYVKREMVMKGIRTAEMSKKNEGLFVLWCQGAQGGNRQPFSLMTVPPRTLHKTPSSLKEPVTTARRVFMAYERRAQAYEAQEAYSCALSLYERLLMYVDKKGLGIVERDRCVGEIMHCVAASSSALLF